MVELTEGTTHKGTELQTVNQMENTPFVKVKNDKGAFIAIGQYRLTPVFETMEEAEEYLTKNMWTTIVNLVSVVVEINDQMNKYDPTDLPFDN